MARAGRRPGALAVLLLAATLALAGAAGAGPELWQAVSEDDLQDVRGRFVTSQGWEIAFGIDRQVVVNGVEEGRYTLPLPASGKTAEPLAFLVGSGSGAISIGPGNVGSLDLPSALPVVIQNTLDGQRIEVSTRIDLRLTGLGPPRAMPTRVDSVLRDRVSGW